MEAFTRQTEGDYYSTLKIQPAIYCLKNDIHGLEFDVIQYVTRWQAKGGLKDLNKAMHTLELMVDYWEDPDNGPLPNECGVIPVRPEEYNGMNALGKYEGKVVSLVTRWRRGGGIPALREAMTELGTLITLHGG